MLVGVHVPRDVGGHPVGQVIRGKITDVDSVHPDELVLVENGGRLGDVVQGEIVYDILQRHHLGAPVQRPAEQHHEVQQRLGQVTLLAVLPDGRSAVPFRKLGAVRPGDHGQMGELRRLEPESLVKLQMARRAGQPLFGAHHVADFHQVVVGYHRQVIGGKTIGLQDYKIFLKLVLPLDIAAYQVMDLGQTGLRHRETNNAVVVTDRLTDCPGPAQVAAPAALG